jgi:hypothetical protein
MFHVLVTDGILIIITAAIVTIVTMQEAFFRNSVSIISIYRFGQVYA